MNEIVIDGTNALLGRLASYAAKQAILGKNVRILKCNEVVISGNKRTIISEYQQTRARGKGTQKGPNFPTVPEKIVKRTIRGMLSHRQKRGLDALKRIRCYNEIPKEYEEVKKIKAGKEKPLQTISLKELAREI
jgi:large subunit ribosomal protein L13